jgi:hypothetical protein
MLGLYNVAKLRLKLIDKVLELDIRACDLVVVCLLTAIFFATVPLSWDGQDVSYFLLPRGKSEEAFLDILQEFFSWFWLIAAIPYLLQGLLLPLGESSLVNQSLWLRLTRCSPYQVAFAKVLWVLAWGLWLGVLGIIWLIATASFHYSFHQFSLDTFVKLLINVEGLVSHVLLAGGIIAISDLFLGVSDYSGRRLISTISVFIPPMILPLLYIAVRDAKFALLFPYTLPFSKVLATESENAIHFAMAAVVGILLLGLYAVSKFSSTVVESKI